MLPRALQLPRKRTAGGCRLPLAEQRSAQVVEGAGELSTPVSQREFPAVHGWLQMLAPGQQRAVGRYVVIASQGPIQNLEGMGFASAPAFAPGCPEGP